MFSPELCGGFLTNQDLEQSLSRLCWRLLFCCVKMRHTPMTSNCFCGSVFHPENHQKTLRSDAQIASTRYPLMLIQKMRGIGSRGLNRLASAKCRKCWLANNEAVLWQRLFHSAGDEITDKKSPSDQITWALSWRKRRDSNSR